MNSVRGARGQLTARIEGVPSTNLRLLNLIGPFACFCLAALSYICTLQYGFVYDDHSQIVENVQIQSWDYLPKLLVTEVWSQRGSEHLGSYFRPLFSVWLLVVHTVGGLSPWVWHLSSLVLHVVATYAVFRLSLRLLRSHPAALLTAGVFAIHPIHIEAVSWISASDEILFSLFFLTSFLLFARKLDTSARNSLALWASLILWGAALLSKETAVALLPIFPLWAFSSKNNTPSQRIAEAARASVPFVVIAVGYLVARSLVLDRSGLETGQHSWSQVTLTGLSVTPFYLGKVTFPVKLAAFYMNPALSTPNFMVWLGAGLLLASIAILIWAMAQRKQVVVASVCLLTLPLIPVLVGIRIFRDGDIAHDRYLYLPSVGFCLLAGALFRYFWTRSKFIKIAVATTFSIVCLAFCWLTFSQQVFYRDDESFFNRALAVGPANPLVMTFLGDVYFQEGKYDLAFQEFRQVTDISPNNFEGAYHLAKALFETKRYAEAEPYLAQLAVDPAVPVPRRGLLCLSLAQTKIRLGKLSDADSVLQGMETQYDTLKGYHQARAVLYEKEGKVDDAKAEYLREYQVSGDRGSQRRASELARAELQGASQ
jgi:protein O-mannosyl-transferase